ncbi:MAG: hypothetical protein NZ601_04580 [candidate division WOR-3 bacterium]|nr:hypothetical protein [candidate division WOR-3 bacterium]MCX7757635.1 hypothetical protein [candidate division WOR-3 bacterium]MDW7987457.1 hypothetical protein [candidate division WOR-3 bacterium]
MHRRILFIILGVIVLVAITFFVIPQTPLIKNVPKTQKKTQTKTMSKGTNLASGEKLSTRSTKDTTRYLSPKPDTQKIEPRTFKQDTELQWGKDPFVRDWVIQEAVTDLKLKAITISPNKSYALINDQILEVGEEISGKKLVKIEKDHVILKQGEREIYLYLGQ